MKISNQRAAVVGIFAQFAALIRLLAESMRLERTASISADRVVPFITGALITAVLVAVSAGLYMAAKYKAALLVALANVAILFAYKISLLLRLAPH